MTWKRTVLRIGKWAAVSIAVLILLVALFFGLAQTKPGKKKIASLVASLLSTDPDTQIKVGKMEGLIPFEVRLDRTTIGDRTGEWLILDNVVFRWFPARLLRGRFHLREISADAVRLERLPPGREKPPQKKDFPTWPPVFPPLEVERLFIGRLSLGQALLGEESVFTVNGRLSTTDPASRLDASLQVRGIEGPKVQTDVKIALKRDEPVLLVDLSMADERGAVLTAVLGRETEGPFSLALRGEGPIDSWKGRLKAGSAAMGAIDADISLSVLGEPMVTADGAIKVSPALLPRELKALAGEENRFSLAMGLRPREAIILNHLELQTGNASLKLSGQLEGSERTLRGEYALRMADLSPLEVALGQRLSGGLDVRGTLSGTLFRPRSTVNISLTKAQVLDFRLERLDGDFQIEPIGDLSATYSGLIIEGKSRIFDLFHEKVDLPEKNLDLALHLNMPAGGDIVVETLDIGGENTSVKLSGRVNPERLLVQSEANIEFKDLKRLSRYLGESSAGAAALQARFNVDGNKGLFSSRISGTLTGHQWPTPPIASVVGSSVQYACDLELKNWNTIDISDLRLSTRVGQLTGEASWGFADNSLRGKWMLRVREMSVLEEIVRTKIGGALDVDGTIEGVLPNPKVNIVLEGRDILLQDFHFSRLSARVDAADLNKRPRGRLLLEVSDGARALNSETDFSLEGHIMTLKNLKMTGAGSTLSGDLALDLEKQIAKGTMRGKSDDLADLSSLIGREIGGTASLTANLSAGKKGQDIKLDLLVKGLKMAEGQVTEVSIDANVADLFGAPQGAAKLQIKKLQRGSVSINAAALSATASKQKVSFKIDASGKIEEAFKMEAQGDLDLSAESQKLELRRFKGQYEKVPLTLDQPAILTRSGGGYDIQTLSIQTGKGNIQVSGKLDPRACDINIAFKGLPLKLLRLAGIENFAGSAEGGMQVKGDATNPDSRLEFRITGLRFEEDALKDLPAATLTAKGSIVQGRLTADMSLDNVTEKPITANMELPIRFSVLPFSASMPKTGDIKGRLDAKINLTRVPTLLRIEDQKLNGKMNIDLNMAGTLEAPKISGFADIQGGSYENTRSGTTLKEIEVKIGTQDRRVVIQQARAAAGEGGTVAARGWLDLQPDRHFPFQVEVTLNKAQLIVSDDINASTDGQIKLSGTVKDAQVTGTLTISPAEIHIPDRLPTEITALEVTEINKPGQSKQPKRTPRAARSSALNLDVGANAPGRVFVRGRGLDSEWSGQLRVRGKADNPAIQGNLSSIRGHMNLFGKRFNLTKGIVSFAGSTPPNPSLDITGEHKRSGFTARVRLTGTPAALDIALESDPPLPRDEILAKVLFGRSGEKMTPAQALMLAQAANTLTGSRVGALDFMDRTRRILKVDQLNVKQSEEGEGGTSLSAGKYLMDKVYVEMEKGTGAESGKASVEVEVLPNISVETEVGEDGQGNIGVNWRWDY